MRKTAIPIASYIILAVAYLTQSGAPLSGQLHSLSIFAVAFLLPSLWAARVGSWRSRCMLCGGCALLAMLALDATAHFVVAKAEMFSILLNSALLYLNGGIVLTSLSFAVAWLASPLRQPIE
jgi:hypothetical protein